MLIRERLEETDGFNNIAIPQKGSEIENTKKEIVT